MLVVSDSSPEDAFDRLKQTDFWVSPKFLDERLALFLRRE